MEIKNPGQSLLDTMEGAQAPIRAEGFQPVSGSSGALISPAPGLGRSAYQADPTTTSSFEWNK